MWIGLMSKGKMDAARPSYQEEYGRKYNTPWDDLFVDEIKRALVACRVFVFYPVYWVVYNQMTTNLVSQGKNGIFSRGVVTLIKEVVPAVPVWYAYRESYHAGPSASYVLFKHHRM